MQLFLMWYFLYLSCERTTFYYLSEQLSIGDGGKIKKIVPKSCDFPGYEIEYDPPKDGSCQFSCLSEELKHLGIAQLSAIELREEIINYLSKESVKPDFKEFIENSDLQTYLQKMALQKTYGDNLTLQAATERFGLHISVISSKGEKYNRDLWEDPVQHEVAGATHSITLGHYGENEGAHYVTLQKVTSQKSDTRISNSTSTG